MAHNIHINGLGRASFFAAREKAWHNLGQIVEQAQTSEEAIKLAGLDFKVGLAPLYAGVEAVTKEGAKEGNIIIAERGTHDTSYSKAAIVPNRFATYRTDTDAVFGVVGSRYEVVQNTQAFDFFDEIIGTKEAIFETAGALGGGETIFVTAKLPSYIKVGKDDIEKYLLFTMSHDGSSSIQIMFTPIRVVCNNTLQAALQAGRGKLCIRHTASVHDKLKIANKALGITNQLSDELTGIFGQLAQTTITDKQVENYFKVVFLTKQQLVDLANGESLSSRQSNILQSVSKYYHAGVGQKEIIGTAWGAYNAVTGYFQNVKKFSDSEGRITSNLLGANYNTMQDALVKAWDYKKGIYTFDDINKIALV